MMEGQLPGIHFTPGNDSSSMESNNYASNDTASQPNVPSLSLPKGGGAIKGISEKVSINSQLGAATINVPIPAQKTRGDLQLELLLNYGSGNGNGVFGAGWELGLPVITRKTDKGLPKYDDLDPSDVFMLSGSEDLVPVIDGVDEKDEYVVRRFRPRVEGSFDLIEWWSNPAHLEQNHWRIISKDNITHVFGYTRGACLSDALDPTRIFQWSLEASFDDKGNAIVYRYRSEDLVGVSDELVSEVQRLTEHSSIAGSYIESVSYGNIKPFFQGAGSSYWKSISKLIASAEEGGDRWYFGIGFDYSSNNSTICAAIENSNWSVRPDPFSSYRAGFEIRTYRRCTRILFQTNIAMEIEGEERGYIGATHALVFGYQDDDGLSKSLDESRILSKLKSIRQIHLQNTQEDGNRYSAAEWPALEFEYTSAAEMVIENIDHKNALGLPEGVDGTRYQWLDLNGEGISGVLYKASSSWWYAPNRWSTSFDKKSVDSDDTREGGRFPLPISLSGQPSTALNSPTARFVDLDGDGALDLLEHSSGTSLVYERDASQSWRPPRSLKRPPALPLDDPNVRMVDLNGDGLAEILLTENDCFVWQQSLGQDGYGTVQRVAKLLDEKRGPRCVFNESVQTVYLADMSGDGLTDIVRIRSGEVSYWPNLGYGKFGARVTMDHAPPFDSIGQFDPSRVRLIDADGSGISDIIYLDRGGARYWANQSGNSWGSEKRIPFRLPHSLANVSSTDFYGRGTGCLVWSSPAPGSAGNHFCVVDLTGGEKPHLLKTMKNNLGAETRFQHKSSTEYYLQDLANGKPWITRLPFPVHVVARIETMDLIARNSFVSRYVYHHGYFDGHEREFRGFGMVEEWDSEHIDSVARSGATDTNWSQESYVPPKLTKTWFHHGACFKDKTLTAAYKREYWSGDPESIDLPDTVLPSGLSVIDEREACRSLRGRMLRQEIYSVDAANRSQVKQNDRDKRPYEVIEQNFTVNLIQGRNTNRHAVFRIDSREKVQIDYERQRDPDPRTSHELTLQVDNYGNVEQSAQVFYRRRKGPSSSIAADKALDDSQTSVQSRTLLTLVLSEFTSSVENLPNSWRTPLPANAKTLEITDPIWSEAEFLDFDTLRKASSDWQDIDEIGYEEKPTFESRQRRLIEHVRTYYRSDNLGRMLPIGELESMALPGESLKLAITPRLLNQLSDKVDFAQLTDYLRDPAAGYKEPDGDQQFWISSGKLYYSRDATGRPLDAEGELVHAKMHFFLPHRIEDPFGAATLLAYDDATLRVSEITDPVGNTVNAEYDYRILQPRLLVDENENKVEAAFDIRGMIVATAILGKAQSGGDFGDTLDGLNPNLSPSEIEAFYNDPVTRAPEILVNATTRHVYDLTRYSTAIDDEKATTPAFSVSLERQFHVNLPFEDNKPLRKFAQIDDFNPADHIQCSFSYSDGFGREIQKKARTAPKYGDTGPPSKAPERWLCSGWVINNNKGQPVREFEPFFREKTRHNPQPHAFEYSPLSGVSPIRFYDPLGRVVVILHPDDSWEKVVFSPWQQANWDQNDTILIDPLMDEDASPYFKRLNSRDWQVKDGQSLTWLRRRSEPVQPEELYPGETKIAKWRRKQTSAAIRQIREHANTPTWTYFDPMAREFVVVTHNRYTVSRSGAQNEEFAHTTTDFDIEGNKLSVTDALGRHVMSWRYDFLGRTLIENSMDAGRRWILPDGANQPLRRWDERDHAFRYTYDLQRRPLESWVAGDASVAGEICFDKITYGELAPDSSNHNLRGKIWEHRDTAGIVKFETYDAKGNELQSTRQFCVDYKRTPDWSNALEVEEETYTTKTAYNALNRPICLITPDSHNETTGSQTFSIYNILGQLYAKTVLAFRPSTRALIFSGWTGEPFYIVRGIDYNARGQRHVEQFGNNRGGYGLRTTYEYDNKTFRLSKLQTVNKDTTNSGQKYQSLHYIYDPVGNILSVKDEAQQTLYFRGQVASPDAVYEYDAVYRLISASGREHVGQNLPPNAWDVHRMGRFDTNCRFKSFPSPNDGSAMRPYTQRYVYDLVGNIEEINHTAGADGSWTRRYRYQSKPGTQYKLSNRLIQTTVGGLTAEYKYDEHGSMIVMPHLPLLLNDFRDQPSVSSRHVETCLDDNPSARGEVTYYVYNSDGERVRKITEHDSKQFSERRYLGSSEFYRKFKSDEINLERVSLHIAEDERRYALFETRTVGDDGTIGQLIRCQFSNHLGSACLEVRYSADLSIISYEEYHPYGSTSYQAKNRSIKSATKRFQFTGKERDEESGLNYHSARYLATWLGRWTSADPAKLSDGINVYSYVGNSPTNSFDPDGRRHVSSIDDSDQENHIETTPSKQNKLNSISVQINGSDLTATASPQRQKNAAVARQRYAGSKPDIFDQFNIAGLRGSSGTKNYRPYFESRFPNTISGSRVDLAKYIVLEVNRLYGLGERPKTLTLPVNDDVDVQPDMERFNDEPQDWSERNIEIGAFEIKAENIRVEWLSEAERKFKVVFDMFVLEQTGLGENERFANDITMLFFVKRHVRMAEWKNIGATPNSKNTRIIPEAKSILKKNTMPNNSSDDSSSRRVNNAVRMHML